MLFLFFCYFVRCVRIFGSCYAYAFGPLIAYVCVECLYAYCAMQQALGQFIYVLCVVFGVCACCPLYVREYLSCLCMLAPLVVLPLTIPMPYIHSITQTLLGPDQSLHQAGASNHLHLHFTHLRAALNLFTTTAVRTRDPIVNSGFHHSSAYITGTIHHHYHYIHGPEQ